MTLTVEGGDPMRAYEIASRIAPQEPTQLPKWPWRSTRRSSSTSFLAINVA